MNFFKTPVYQLYLFQLENYEIRRYLKLLWNKGLLPKPGQRKDIVWTAKARTLFFVGTVLYVLIPALTCYFFFSWLLELGIRNYELWLLLLISYFLFLLASFIFYIFAYIFLYPVDYLLKQIIVSKAKSKISQIVSLYPRFSPSRGEEGRGGLIVIGIAGSYGKTTMKEVLRQVLSVKYKVESTPESVNTPVGVARFILKNVSSETEVLIVEMGEHYKGDVKEICQLVKPDIVVVTGINEAHLERTGGMQNTIETIFEVVQNSKPNVNVYINADDKNVLDNYERYVLPDQKSRKYKVESIKQAVFNPKSLKWECEHETMGRFNLSLLGKYALGNADCAIQIAQSLGVNSGDIIKGFETITPVSHRLKPTLTPSNILVIDDAYNGNSAGAEEAIETLARFHDRRKLYITPGLVETGRAAKEVHVEIGRQLAGVADVVILIKNSVTRWIEEGILSVIARSAADEAIPNKRLPRPSDAFGARNDNLKIIWFNSTPEAHAALKEILKPNDVIVFQNDWGDQYI